MNNSKILIVSFLNALGVLIYTSAVAWVLFNGERLFGKVRSFWGPLAILLLFVLSATVVGLLVLGRPGYLYFNGAQREGITLLLYTVGWLFIFCPEYPGASRGDEWKQKNKSRRRRDQLPHTAHLRCGN